MAGFSSISVQGKAAQSTEPQYGFKSVSIVSNQKQYIEPANGFKSISVVSAAVGFSSKIIH